MKKRIPNAKKCHLTSVVIIIKKSNHKIDIFFTHDVELANNLKSLALGVD